jgi:hypothetical protein
MVRRLGFHKATKRYLKAVHAWPARGRQMTVRYGIFATYMHAPHRCGTSRNHSHQFPVQEQVTSIPRLLLPPAPDGHSQAGQRYRKYPIHPELVRHGPLGLCAILTRRVIEEAHAEYSLLLFSMSLARVGEDEPTGTLGARTPWSLLRSSLKLYCRLLLLLPGLSLLGCLAARSCCTPAAMSALARCIANVSTITKAISFCNRSLFD